MAKKFSQFTDGLTNQSPTDILVGLDVSLAANAQNSFWTLNSLFSVITRNITDGALRFGGFAAPSLSAAGAGALYFDSSSNTFKISQNGGTYANLLSGTVTVPQGGTGLTSLTAYAVMAGGTTTTGNVQQVSGLGSSGQVLTSNGAAALPSWQAVSGSPAGSGTELQYRASASAFGAITGSSVSGANLTMTGIAQAVLRDAGGQVFNVKAYGAVGDGVTNDTAAIQAAATAALAVTNTQGGKGAVVFFPPGSYLVTSTIYINNVANDPNFNTQSEISVLGSGRLVTCIVWGGASGGNPLRFWFNKRYSFKEMYIVNAANDRTGVGVRSIGATSISGNVAGGNAIWQNIEIRGFEKGWYIGDSVSQTSGSEYVIDNLATTNCVYGVLLEGSNTENLTFRIPQFSSCQYGLYNGGGNNIHIWGGASSATSTAVFTNVTQGEMSVVGFRSESDNAFIAANVGGMYVAACTVTNNTSAGKVVTSHIGGPFRLTYINNTFDGVVTMSSSTHGEECYLRMFDNRLFYTASLTVPFLVTSGGSGTIKGMGITAAGNKQYAANQTTFIQKFNDIQGSSTDGSIANIANAVQFNPDTSNGVATPATPQLNLETLTSINTTSANKATFGGAITASFETKAGDPTTSDIAAGRWALYKNTSSGVLSLWANDGGVMKSVALT